jgi:hypothetical protein
MVTGLLFMGMQVMSDAALAALQGSSTSNAPLS